MNKMKQSTKARAWFIGALLIALITVGSVVKAEDSSLVKGFTEFADRLEVSVARLEIAVSELQKNTGDVLGAAANRPIQYVYDYVNGFFVNGSQVFDADGNFTSNGSGSVSGTSTINNLATKVVSGSFADATTTLFCVPNPFVATSTVDLAILYVSGASTTSVDVYVTTSTLLSISSTTTISTGASLINAARIPANTTTTVITNGISADTAGGISAGTGTADRIRVLPSENVCGVVGAGAGTTAGVTGGSNFFDGTYKLRFFR